MDLNLSEKKDPCSVHVHLSACVCPVLFTNSSFYGDSQE